MLFGIYPATFIQPQSTACNLERWVPTLGIANKLKRIIMYISPRCVVDNFLSPYLSFTTTIACGTHISTISTTTAAAEESSYRMIQISTLRPIMVCPDPVDELRSLFVAARVSGVPSVDIMAIACTPGMMQTLLIAYHYSGLCSLVLHGCTLHCE